MSASQTRPGDWQRDGLTGLPSVEIVRERLAHWLGAPGGGDGPRVHALLLGLRRFDAVNLAYGSTVGDAALIEVAARIVHFAADELDGGWLAARTGSDFLLIANEACSRERWQLLADQLVATVAAPVLTNAGALRLSPRAAMLRGVADEDASALLDRLGATLETVQRSSGRRLAWADGVTTRPGRSAAQLEADLLRAIDNDEIEVLYQPQFALADDRLSGAEALARWQHPKLGRIGAGALFAIAERADHVAPLSRHIAGIALGHASKWPQTMRLSLNVTPLDLAAGGFARDFLALVRSCGFDPARLTLEVLEQTLVHDLQLAARMLGELADHGVRFALDDFGAGFCNFRYLKLLPLHYLKLDRSMVDGIADEPRDLAVLRAIVAMAGALDLAVIAEGIENEAQRAAVAAEGCAFYQGFLRAQPMSAEDFAALTHRLPRNRA